jgi:sigma-B regulation protein RsbU (phosphoserine phosphatase)
MNPVASQSSLPVSVDSFLLEVADIVNSTLDLDTQLQRVAEITRRVVQYEIFAILLFYERTQDLRIRFQIGHTEEVHRLRIKVGQGITGQAVLRREAMLVNDVSQEANYISAHPSVRSELAVPLIVKGKVIGVIDIQAAQKDYFTEEHRRLLMLVASRIATGIENARLYTRVARQARTLGVLNEISRELTSILHLDELLERVGVLLRRLIDYQMFSVLLLDPAKTALQHRFAVRYGESVHLKHDIPVGTGLVGHAVAHKQPVLVADVKKDPRYIELNPETRSELCVPLIYKDQAIGVLDIEHTRRAYFTEDHMRTITTLAAQVAIAVENARLYERIARDEQRMERDLEMARELQTHLLPSCCPTLDRAQLSARFVPATAIGGDLYEFVEYSLGRLGVAVGDVSGKGAPAALYGALASGILRSHAVAEPEPSEMLAAMNLSLRERPIHAQFLAMIFAVWDGEQRTMSIANSALPRPVLCRAGQAAPIDCGGLPLGLFEEAAYEQVTVEAQAGDVFVLFSDGILDARNAADASYGRQRLQDVIALNAPRSAEDIVAAIFASVNSFTAGAEPFDDQTVVVLKVE